MKLQLTNAGKQLLTNAMMGGPGFIFRRCELGAGARSADKAQKLVDSKMKIPYAGYTIETTSDGNFIHLIANYDNSKVAEPFNAREMGVFVSETASDTDLTLYAYGTVSAAEADYIPAGTGADGSPVQTKMEIIVYIGKAANVSAIVNSSLNYVTHEEFDVHEHDERYYTEDEIDEMLEGLPVESLISHIGNTSNPHSVTKAQVGLGNVENKSASTILSEMTASNVTTALGYTPLESVTVDSALSSTSENPVQNKAINTALSGKSDTTHTHSDYISKTDTTQQNVASNFGVSNAAPRVILQGTGSGNAGDVGAVVLNVDGNVHITGKKASASDYLGQLIFNAAASDLDNMVLVHDQSQGQDSGYYRVLTEHTQNTLFKRAVFGKYPGDGAAEALLSANFDISVAYLWAESGTVRLCAPMLIPSTGMKSVPATDGSQTQWLTFLHPFITGSEERDMKKIAFFRAQVDKFGFNMSEETYYYALIG